MATRAELMQALRNADAAGDTEAASRFAAMIQALPAEGMPAPQEPAAPPPDTRPSWEQDPEGFAQRVEAEKASLQEQYDPTKGQSFGRNVLQGTGRAFSGMGRGVQQLWNYATGDEEDTKRLQQEEAQARGLDEALMGTGGGKVGYYGTEAGLTLLPATKIAKLPAVVKGGRAALAASEAGLGAIQGGMQATTEGESHLSNAGIGATIGAALPYVKPLAGAADKVLARVPIIGKGSLMMREIADRQAGRASREAAQAASLANQAAGREFKAAALRQKAEEKAANLAAKETAAATRDRAKQVIENQVGRNSGLMPVSEDFAKRMASLSRHYGDELPESFHRGVAQINVPGASAKVPYQAVAQMKSDLGAAAREASRAGKSPSALHRAEREVAEGMLETMPQRRANLLRTAYGEYASGASQSARRGVKRPVTPGPVQVPVQGPGRGQQVMNQVLDYTRGMPAALRRQLARNLVYGVYPKDEEGE